MLKKCVDEIQDVASLLKSSSAGVSFSDWAVQAAWAG